MYSFVLKELFQEEMLALQITMSVSPSCHYVTDILLCFNRLLYFPSRFFFNLYLTCYPFKMVKLICSSLYTFSDDAFSNIGNNVLKLNMWRGTSNTYMIQYILQIKSNNYCLEEFSRYHL